MTTIPARQLAREYSQVLQRVKQGEVIGVVVNDEVVAILYPPEEFEIQRKTVETPIDEPKCEMGDFDTSPTSKPCVRPVMTWWTVPSDWQFAGQKFRLCDMHYKQVTS